MMVCVCGRMWSCVVQVRLKEAGVASEIIAVSVGPKQAQEQIRSALAMVHFIPTYELWQQEQEQRTLTSHVCAYGAGRRQGRARHHGPAP